MTRVREHADVLVQVADISTNKQAYTATFSSNVYTVTPEINPTVWPALQAGLIIRVRLPANTISTGAISINFNGTTSSAKWVNGEELKLNDLNSDLVPYIDFRRNADNETWLIISDVSGSATSGSWERRANGTQSSVGTVSYNKFTSAAGNIFDSQAYNKGLPQTYIDLFYSVVASDPSDKDIWFGTSISTTQNAGIKMFSYQSYTSEVSTVVVYTSGRWYN